MAKALVVYATRTNETQRIAQLIAEGIRFKGMEAEVIGVSEFDQKAIDPESYDAIVLGAATYHGDMLQAMKTLLFTLEKPNLEGKVGGSFGAFGWSGEAPDRIFDTMKHIFKMDMISGPLRLKSASLGGGIKMAQEYGGEIAEKVLG
jgi:flavorubredoxin